MEKLASRGHNLTIISADVEKDEQPNLHYIELEQVYQVLYGGPDKLDIMDMTSLNDFQKVISFYDWFDKQCEGKVR